MNQPSRRTQQGRLAAAIEGLEAILDDAAEAPVWALSGAEVTDALSRLYRLRDRVDGQLARVLAHAAAIDAASDAGATSTPSLVRELHRTTHSKARAEVALAVALDDEVLGAPVGDALVAGEISAEHASVITAAVEALPGSVGVDDRVRATRHLLGEAARLDPRELRLVGRHLLAVLDPDHADELEARALEEAERKAARACFLETYDDGKGIVHGRFQIPSLHGELLATMLGALTNPDRPDPIPKDTDHGRRSTAEVRGEALCQLLERYPTDRLPVTGGVAATVVVTMTVQTLEGRLEAAGILGSGTRLSPGEARRLACAAGVIPAVLGGRSQVLDLGRKRRLHTPAQRLALALEQDGVCAVERCGRPWTWCDAHHLHAWGHGGGTDTVTGALLCARHHTLAHQPHLDLRSTPDGKHRFYRRE